MSFLIGKTVNFIPEEVKLALTAEKWAESELFNGLSPNSRISNEAVWDEVLSSCNYLPATYTNSNILYQWQYQRGLDGCCQDLSIIINSNNKPVAIWPLSLSKIDNFYSLTSHGLPVHPPLFVKGCSVSIQKRIIKCCFELSNIISNVSGIKMWQSSDSFLDLNGLSSWHILAKGGGAKSVLAYDLFIDLRQDLNQIKSGFRRSYRSLVNSGLKNWTVGILDVPNKKVWQSFKDLHKKVAGRTTRNNETWEIQFNDIANQQAFLIYLLNNDGEMDGAGFFNFTKDEGLYSVAAYKRELFDKPLGHVVQYRAIEELKKRKVRWYKLGSRPYATDNPPPSKKEISIGEFKQGFASHIFPRYLITHFVKDPNLNNSKG